MDPVRYPDGDLPAGAVSVRLCPGPPLSSDDGPGIQPPADVLTSRVDELVTVVNDLRPPPEDQACHLDGGPRLTYWFSYPDGDARAVTFEHFGCGMLVVGDEARRTDGARVARLFSEALLEQRAAAGDPPGAGPPPSCERIWSEPRTALPAVPADLETATLCVDAGPRRFAPAAVPTELVERLEAELAATAPASRCGNQHTGRPLSIVLARSRWGDRIDYVIEPCGRVYLPYPAGWPRDSEAYYALSDGLLADLDALPLGSPVRVDQR